MNTFRSRATQEAVQYLGEPIPDVVCDGDFAEHGCDHSRKHLPHVHSKQTGGMTMLRVGDWIMPQKGGPFVVASDADFRSYFEVPAEAIPADKAIPDDSPAPGIYEVKHYTDGAVASGTGPLPLISPAGAPEVSHEPIAEDNGA